MDFILLATKVITRNAQELAIWSAIMVSMIIAFVGIIKPFVFPNHKELRKTSLSLINMGASFASTAIYFIVNGINWRWYFTGAFLMVIATIVTYHLYETFHLREAIHKVGNFAIDKFARLAKIILSKLVNDEDVDVKASANTTFKEVSAYAKSEFKKATKKIVNNDNELENL